MLQLPGLLLTSGGGCFNSPFEVTNLGIMGYIHFFLMTA